MNEQIVMRDSPEAAQYRTDLKGWVSRNGYDYGDAVTRDDCYCGYEPLETKR